MSPITTLLPTVTNQFLGALRAQAMLTRVANRDFDNAPQERGDTINVRLPVAQTPVAVTPSAAFVAPQAADTEPQTLTLNRWFERSMGLTDKEVSDIEAGNIPQQLEQMAVDLAEFINADGYAAAIAGAGWVSNTTPGTSAFATNEAPWLNALKNLEQLRAPRNNRVGILNTDAYYNAILLPNIAQADRRGDAANPLVTGVISNTFGVPMMSDQLVTNQTTAALGAGALTANGVNAAGSRTISIAKGAGANVALVAGDVITIAGHVRPYVVAANVTVVQAANTVVTLNLGLSQATVGGEAITLVGAGSTYANSLVMHRDGLYFASRPLRDWEGIANSYTISDPQTGLFMRAELVRQNRQTRLAFDCLYGWKVIRAGHVGRLLGA